MPSSISPAFAGSGDMRPSPVGIAIATDDRRAPGPARGLERRSSSVFPVRSVRRSRIKHQFPRTALVTLDGVKNLEAVARLDVLIVSLDAEDHFAAAWCESHRLGCRDT